MPDDLLARLEQPATSLQRLAEQELDRTDILVAAIDHVIRAIRVFETNDIPDLIGHFRCQASLRLERDPCQLAADAQQLLESYHWPGNVRELENIVTRACVLHGGKIVTSDDLRPWLLACNEIDALGDTSTLADPSVVDNLIENRANK